ncbi:MAG: hypothetical protein ACE5FU_11830 [Nitrospinota bacterium]
MTKEMDKMECPLMFASSPDIPREGFAIGESDDIKEEPDHIVIVSNEEQTRADNLFGRAAMRLIWKAKRLPWFIVHPDNEFLDQFEDDD